MGSGLREFVGATKNGRIAGNSAGFLAASGRSFAFPAPMATVICSPVSTNPVYAFFATPKSFGPFVLRLLLTAVFVFHGGQKGFGLFGGEGWQATVLEWSKGDGLNFPIWLSTLVIATECLSAIGLFFGFFTRLFAFGLMCVMGGAVWFVHWGQGVAACEYPFALLIVALALVFLGAGRFSVDRVISGQLLPAVG